MRVLTADGAEPLGTGGGATMVLGGGAQYVLNSSHVL